MPWPIFKQTEGFPMNQPRRLVDFQLSVSAIISGCVTVASFMVWMGYTASQQASKMENMAQTLVKVEKRLDDRDQRLDLMRDAFNELRTETKMNSMRIGELERIRK
jgi:hypothetical protein